MVCLYWVAWWHEKIREIRNGGGQKLPVEDIEQLRVFLKVDELPSTTKTGAITPVSTATAITPVSTATGYPPCNNSLPSNVFLTMSFFANQKNVLAANTALQQAHDSILGGGGTSDEKSESLPALEYSAKMIESVMSRLTSKCVENLVNIDTSHSYKFLVSCVICQNNGTGLHKGSACLWNAENDSSIVVRFENTELMCLATCFAIAL